VKAVAVERLGARINAFVNRVTQGGEGKAFALMSAASLTLPQALLLRRLQAAPGDGVGELAEAMQTSLPAMSQMVDRLVRSGYVARLEDPHDRRCKRLTATASGSALLKRLERACADDYESGVAPLSAKTRSLLATALQAALSDLGQA
jgi:DNA-binding MarR family transcriptional regulator